MMADFAFRSGKKRTYGWDEAYGKVYPLSKKNRSNPEKDSDVRHAGTHANGVRKYEWSFEGSHDIHTAYEVEANHPDEAKSKFIRARGLN